MNHDEGRADGLLDVTIIIPARNEESSIAQCLRGIQAQTYPANEVLVIDGNSDDATASIVRDYAQSDPRIRLIANEARVTPVALNIGLANATSTVLIRIDAHAVPAKDYVERIVHHLTTGKWAGVGGVKVALGGASRLSQVIAAALSSKYGVGGSAYHHATTAQETDHIPFGAYLVDTLRAVGGWNSHLMVNQDFELDHRIRDAGGRLLLDPQITVRWKSSQNLKDLAHQYRRYGVGKATVARLHPRSLRVRHLLPPALLLLIGTSSALAVLGRPKAIFMNTPYVAVLASAPLVDKRAFGNRASNIVLAPIVLSVMHLSWGVGFLTGLVRPHTSRRASDPYRPRDLAQNAAGDE